MATRFVDRGASSNLGKYVYGAGAIALGVIGLVWTDFATNWQRVQGNVPHRGRSHASRLSTNLLQVSRSFGAELRKRAR
jgi:hypothetical protein